MNIAFITLGFAPLRMSGLDTSGERLVLALLGAGHHVTVIAAARGSTEETLVHPALHIHRITLGRSNWIGFARRAASRLESLQRLQTFDVIHFWDVHFAFAYRGPFVASLHQSFRQRRCILKNLQRPARWLYAGYYAWARRFAESPALSRALGLLAVSQTTRQEFIQNYKLAPGRVALARHGIDTELYRPAQTDSGFRRRLGLALDEPVILFVGFATPRKGLDYLARAVPLIRPRPRLVIAGQWSENYRSHFMQLLGTDAGRLVEAGFVPDDQMPALYSMADVYVSPSLLEGFGLPLAEALACGTPVVATAVGASAEIVGPGGKLVPPQDPVALAAAISHLLTARELGRALGIQGREHIRREFSIPAMLEATLTAYRQFT